MNRFRIIVLFVLALLMTFGFIPKAEAFVMPPAIIADAQLMECDMLPGHGEPPGGGISGDCKVTNNKIGNQFFLLIRYDNATAAVASWQAELDADQFFARDGHVLIFPMGTWANGTPYDEWWAGYAAAKTGGVVKHG